MWAAVQPPPAPSFPCAAFLCPSVLKLPSAFLCGVFSLSPLICSLSPLHIAARQFQSDVLTVASACADIRAQAQRTVHGYLRAVASLTQVSRERRGKRPHVGGESSLECTVPREIADVRARRRLKAGEILGADDEAFFYKKNVRYALVTLQVGCLTLHGHVSNWLARAGVIDEWPLALVLLMHLHMSKSLASSVLPQRLLHL